MRGHRQAAHYLRDGLDGRGRRLRAEFSRKGRMLAIGSNGKYVKRVQRARATCLGWTSASTSNWSFEGIKRLNCDWSRRSGSAARSPASSWRSSRSEDDEDPNKPGPGRGVRVPRVRQGVRHVRVITRHLPFPVPSPFHPPSSILLSKKAIETRQPWNPRSSDCFWGFGVLWLVCL